MRWRYRKLEAQLYDADVALIHAVVWGRRSEIEEARQRKRSVMLELLEIKSDAVLRQIAGMDRETIIRLYGGPEE